MQFDIILITRNRQSVLPISIPLMLSQNRLPNLFVVVDSSDNQAETREVVENTFRRLNIDIALKIIPSKPGTSYQRNIGLKHTISPIVLFPDDDALWFPGVAESIMRIYERDEDGSIGAVCASESFISPPGVLEGMMPYRMDLRDRFQLMISPAVHCFESMYFPDPLMINIFSKSGYRKPPNWFQEEGAALSGPMTGFRMSFRTEVIRRLGFDEALGRYSLFEDRDASLGVLKNYMIVCAKRAKVFHYRSPEPRTSGIEFGMMHILNRTYVVCKHSNFGSLARRRLRRYLYYKVGRYLLQGHNKYGRQRLIGAWRGLLFVPKLLDAPLEELSQRYKMLRNKCLNYS